MKLQPTVESLDSIPETLRDNYEQAEDGTYRLNFLKDYVPADKVEDVGGLKSALGKEREAAREAARKLKAMQEQFAGFDVEEYQALKDAQHKAEEERAKKAGEFDALKAQMMQKHQEELSKKDKEILRRTAALEKRLVDSEAVSALNDLKGNVTLLLPHVKAHVKVVEDDAGQFVARVVDDAGNPRVNGEGKFLTVRDLVSEMRDLDAYAPGFANAVKSGGGTPPNGTGGEGAGGKKGGIPTDLRRSKMTPRQKVDFVKEHGEKALLDLPL